MVDGEQDLEVSLLDQKTRKPNEISHDRSKEDSDKTSPNNATINIIQNVTNISPGSTGTLMSFLTVTVGIIVSIICYQYVAESESLSSFNELCSDDLYKSSCKANSAVLRISFALTLLFSLQIIGTALLTDFYDRFWGLKVLLFIVMVISFFYTSADIFGTNGYAWFARITGFFFVILEQVILIDLAYTWNEKWIEYSQQVDVNHQTLIQGNVWLTGIIVFSCIFFFIAYLGIGLMFQEFNTNCQDTITILSLAIVLPFIATIIQLFFADRGSILTSAIMTLYSSYVCFSSISLNPNDSCNPTLNSKYQTISSIIGLFLTAVSLIWTTYNAVKKIPQVTDRRTGDTIDLTNIATGGEESQPTSSILTSVANPYSTNVLKQLFLQVSFVFLCVSGYYAMVLTNWSTEQSDVSISSPRAGSASMWIQAIGSWIAIGLYLWTLIAPKILSERDFE